LEQNGIEACYSNGKQLHLAYCRSVFENVAANRPDSYSSSKISGSSILLIDDDSQNIRLASDNGHMAFLVENDAKLSDLLVYLTEQTAN
jgi:hypothetical protein